MSARHTPGPWACSVRHIDGGWNEYDIHQRGGSEPIARFEAHKDTEAEANASLMAAAPELLAALLAIIDSLDQPVQRSGFSDPMGKDAQALAIIRADCAVAMRRAKAALAAAGVA